MALREAELLPESHYPAGAAALAMHVTVPENLGIIGAQRSESNATHRTMQPMKRTRLIPFAVACSLAVFVLPAGAAEAGDAAAGKAKTSMCAGCHGIGGYKTAFPAVYSVPKLGGQHAAYIVKALQEYKAGTRSHPTMRAIAAGLSDKDMADLGAYYAAESVRTAGK